jgi:inner membrane transporter RhtA
VQSTKARVAAPALLVLSAVFHYLGPAFAVLLFAHVDPFGVAWLRIVSAAVVFALWWRAWRVNGTVIAFGVVLAAMNTVFYLAIARLPLSTVGAVEFLGVIVLAAAGVRTRRNAIALVVAIVGVFVLADVRLAGEPVGFLLVFANCALFVLYVVLGHRIAATADRAGQLATAMIIAALIATPAGLGHAFVAFDHPVWLLAGIGVGVCSSVIPYLLDQFAMAQVSRATFAVLLCLLPASATVIGLVVLGQRPTVQDLLGTILVIAGVAIHVDRERT